MKKRFTRHLLRWKDKIWSKIHNKEFMMYVLLGATTTILNLFSYDVLCIVLDYWIANIIAGIFSKVYSYFTNKFFVFKSRCANVGELLKELGMYIVTTGISGTIDLVGVPFLVSGLAFDKKIAKYIMAVVVIIVNYILRKKIVFRKKTENHRS